MSTERKMQSEKLTDVTFKLSVSFSDLDYESMGEYTFVSKHQYSTVKTALVQNLKNCFIFYFHEIERGVGVK